MNRPRPASTSVIDPNTQRSMGCGAEEFAQGKRHLEGGDAGDERGGDHRGGLNGGRGLEHDEPSASRATHHGHRASHPPEPRQRR
jgi:hypothetical protein